METSRTTNGYISLDVVKLRELMDQRAMRQTELADRANLSRVRVSTLLRDDSPRVHSQTERKLTSAFGLPAGSLDKHNVETSYRRAVVRANDTLDFTGLGVVSTDRPIPMDRGFAPLCVLDKPRDARKPDRAPVSDERPRQPKHQAIALEKALMRCQRFFLLGDPGAGKTTTLRHLAHTYACGEERNRSYPAETWIPIYVRLADWAQQLGSGADMDVMHAAVAQLTGTDLDAQSTTQWLRDKAKQGSVLLLLDGLDEVADPDLQAAVIERIRSFVQAHSEAHVVTASRAVGFNAPKLGVEFDQLTIAPLDEEGITAFICEWSAFRHGHKSDRGCPTCNKDDARLHRAVLENKQIRTLAGNPMMLTILCLLCDAGATLPQRRWQLYEKIAEAFLFSWEERKRAGGPGALDHTLKLDDREVVWLLESVAIEMQRRDFTIVPRWWLLEHCATFLKTELRFGNEDARSEAEALVWSLQERAGLLVERGLERYGFQHLGFQEYFAARAILARDDPIEALQPYIYHPRWREVVRFVAAQLDRRRASQLLRTILDDPDPTGRFLHRGLFIALGCLVDGAPGYDNEVLENLKHEIASLATSEWHGIVLEVVDSVARLREGRLKEFSREALDPLLGAPDPDLRMWVRIRLAWASFMSHSEQPEIEGPEDVDADTMHKNVCEVPFQNTSQSMLMVVSSSSYDPDWAREVFDQLHTDSSSSVRAVCAEELGRFSKRNPSVRRGLLKALREEQDSEVREAIVEALEPAANVPAVRDVLLAAVDHEHDDAVRGACACALGRVAAREASVRQKLISIMTSNAPCKVRAGAARGLRECASKDTDAHTLMMKILTDDNSDADLRVACLRSLEDILPRRPYGVGYLEVLLDTSPESHLAGVGAQILAEYVATGRVDWNQPLVEKIEQVLVGLKEPCPHALDALRALVDARELRKRGMPREARIKQAFADVAERIRVSFVFGSAARGDQGPDSDIDLMVIGDVSLRELTPGLKRAEQQLGRQVNVVVHSPVEWKKRCHEKNPFVMEVMRGKKKFVIGGQDELTAMA